MIIVFVFPIEFTACSPNSLWCSIAYQFTVSGGPLGFVLLLCVTGIFYASTGSSAKERFVVFLKSTTALAVFFGLLAYLNEHFTKHILKAPRPSHQFMLNQIGLSQKIDSLYQLDKSQRYDFFATLIKNNPLQFRQIDLEIQQHWIDEAGFSFPSGHTFNAFLFAMIISYAIYHNRSRQSWRQLFLIPFIWAITVGVSRVAIGAHSALDVSAGATLGIIVGAVFLYVDITRHWLTRKR